LICRTDHGFISVNDTLPNGSTAANRLHKFFLHMQRTEAEEDLVNALWSTDIGKQAIMRKVCDEINTTTTTIAQPSSRYSQHVASVLYKKDIEELSTFDWDTIMTELVERHSMLCQILLSVCMPASRVGSNSETERAVKKMCTTYSILMNNRNKDMSLLQRVFGGLLESQHVRQKV
jgi:hypothetical protein